MGATLAELKDDNGAAGAQAWGPVGSLLALSSGGVASAQTQADSLLASAKSGGFKITEQGVQPLLKAIDDMRNQMPTMQTQARIVAGTPMLGSHRYGGTVAAHVQKAGAGVPGSVTEVLTQFDRTLDTLAEALERASGLYKEADAGAQAAFRGTRAKG
jgi:hypothetical protein